VAALGDGNDLFTWNPGDGSDVVDGQRGVDTLVFNGSNIGENIGISVNGGQATLTRDVGAVTMHLTSVERIELSTLSGADHIAVNDLSGTGVRQVAIDLAASFTGSGDGQEDTVTINGTAGNDHVNLTASGSLVTVSGLPAQVTVDHGEAGDLLTVNGGAGNDAIDASETNDTITGGTGNAPGGATAMTRSCSISVAAGTI
jgi:hypothetical protein